jgi:thiamine biosynthesis lipoprotein
MTGTCWAALGTTAHVVAEERVLPAAAVVVRRQLDEVDAACSRFRDSELSRLRPGRQRVSSLLAEVLTAALDAAHATDGLVDPTLGRAMHAAGYDRTLAELPADGPRVAAGPAGRWQEVHLDGDVLELPDVALDLGATAKAWAADRAAQTVADRFGCEVLVNLGGDLATAGGTWPVLVGDAGGPQETVEVTGALATSSTTLRTWRRGGLRQHHVIDPRTGRPADPVWQTVTASAATCLQANTAATAAIVLGREAVAWLANVPARLVDATGHPTYLGGWPT